MKGLNAYPYWVRAVVGVVLLGVSIFFSSGGAQLFGFVFGVMAVGMLVPTRKPPAI